MTTRLQELRDVAIATGRLADSWDCAADHRAAAEAYRLAEAEGKDEANAWQDGEWAIYHETKARTCEWIEDRDRPTDGRIWCAICGTWTNHHTGYCEVN